MDRNKQEFLSYARRRIIEKNSRADKECGAYYKNANETKRRKWSVRAGGYKY